MRDGEIDYCLELPGIGRFRANSYRQQRGFDSVYRVVSAEPPTLESLGLPADLAKFTTYHQGMVLITGPAGCGKSATMAAMVKPDQRGARRAHPLRRGPDRDRSTSRSKKCLVNQRHAGRHTRELRPRASRRPARRPGCDRDRRAARPRDHLVGDDGRGDRATSCSPRSTPTAPCAPSTASSAPSPPTSRGRCARCSPSRLRAVISQRLVPQGPTAHGRAAGARAAGDQQGDRRTSIRDEKTVQIRSSIQTGKSQGMYLLEQSPQRAGPGGHDHAREAALAATPKTKKLITAK